MAKYTLVEDPQTLAQLNAPATAKQGAFDDLIPKNRFDDLVPTAQDQGSGANPFAKYAQPKVAENPFVKYAGSQSNAPSGHANPYAGIARPADSPASGGPWDKFQPLDPGPWSKYAPAADNPYAGIARPTGNYFDKYDPPRGRLTLVDDPKTLGELHYGLDLAAPDREVRARIAYLPADEQDKARRLWAKYQVQQLRNAGFKQRPDVARGIPVIGSYLDEATAGIQGALFSLTDGRVGAPYDEALAFERERTKAAEAENPAEAAVGQIAAGIATGGQLLGSIKPAATLLGRVFQGGKIGLGVGAAEGFGQGEETFTDRLASAQKGAAVGTTAGAVFPVVASGVSRGIDTARGMLGPTVTRWREGPDAAAEAILARRIRDEGSSPSAKIAELDRGQTEAARLNTNSVATLPETLADTSDDLQRLTGSLYRQGGEPGNFVRETLERRQRGPINPFAPRDPNAAPDGQMERVIDAAERALLVRSSESARQTERSIMQAQAREGRKLYDQAYRQSEAFDIQPALDGLALTAQQYPVPFRARLVRALNLFLDDSPRRLPVDNIQRFDAAKKALDDMIEKSLRAGEGNLTRELTSFKDSLLRAVHAADDAGTPTINKTYFDARQAWGTAAENRQAIELGRAALRENSEISAEQFRELTKGQQQLFRLGFIESLRNSMSSMRPGSDVTQLLQQRRVQDLLRDVIPRSKNPSDVFANRPERFGDYLNREQRMVQTRNQVLGGSPTQQRGQDDAAFAGDALATMWNRFRSSPSLFNMGIEAVGVGIQKVFGYRRDVAMSLAQRLLETDPARRTEILRRLQQRSGRSFAEFAEMLDRTGNTLAGATTSSVNYETSNR
jgi:hypothetical protein